MVLHKLKDFLSFIKLEAFSTNLIKHEVGNNNYKVYDDFTNKYEAAQILDKVSIDLLAIIKYIDKKYNINNIHNQYNMTKNDKKYILDSIIRVKKNFIANNLQENLPSIFDKDTSYTINKGEIFALCLRFVDNKDEFHDFNTIMFVAIHELSHLFSKTYGHNTEFWTNFRFLLKQAVEIGLYKPINYKLHKKPYCSIMITYNPLYDNNLKDY